MFQGDNIFLLTIQLEEHFETHFTAAVSITFGKIALAHYTYR